MAMGTMALRAIVPGTVPVVGLVSGRTLWMAEAETGHGFVERKLHGEADCFPRLGKFAGAVGKMPSFSVLDMSGQLIRFSIPIATVAIFGAAAFPICWIVLALLGF